MDTPETDSVDGTGASAAPEAGERIAKRLARAGLCSRRDAERWIAEGRVEVNGRTLDSPACVVRPGDTLVVDGKPVPEPEPARLWRYHKPSGLVTTARDEKGRDTVFSALPSDMPRVVSVGRLDLTTEGLLLLTNDGELARFLELPATGWTRRYRVRVHGMVNEKQLANLSKGLTIEGIHYGPIEAVLDRVQGANAWLTVGIKEGKNREIRKVMETLGLVVTRLIRIAYGPFQLGKLDEGAVEEVPKRVLKDQLARFFAAQSGEDAEPSKPAAKASPKPARRPAAPKAASPRAEAPALKSRPARSERFSDERPAGNRFGGDERPAPKGRPVRGERFGDERPAGNRFGGDERPAPKGRPVRGERFGDERPAGNRFGGDERPAPKGRPVRGERFGDERPAGNRFGGDERPAPKGRPARGERFGDERPAGNRFGGDERPAPKGRPVRGERFGDERPAGNRFGGDERPAPKGRPVRGERFGDERPAGNRFGGDERPAPKGRPVRGERFGDERPAGNRFGGDERPAPKGRPAKPAPAKSASPKSAPQKPAPAGRGDARTEAPRPQGNRASFSERLRLDRPEGGKPGNGPRGGGGRADRRR
ncbi:23S rRNA pseudouridine2605 synthase [Azospirillum fermentarium]|uniref:pseudouridine synthase n=1 Tax=Azospirillum fermentarium TaxID=1233114 RepID=UPI0029CAB011|nr:pseudouridine synthase [Azospirillum fermentarium]MCW2244434.1 23S rRNA pseudouridine2605 synthase [Azospirillum fermentarium]